MYPAPATSKPDETFDGTERSDDLLRDDFGRLAQRARAVAGRWAWRFRRDADRAASPAGSFSISRSYFSFSTARRRSREPLFQFQNHARASKILDFQGDFSICGAAPLLISTRAAREEANAPCRDGSDPASARCRKMATDPCDPAAFGLLVLRMTECDCSMTRIQRSNDRNQPVRAAFT